MPSRRRLRSAWTPRAALWGATALLGGALVFAPLPSQADPATSPADRPTIAEVRSRLDTLHRQAEIASESFNTVRVQMQDARQRLRSLEADVDRQRTRVGSIRSQVVGGALSDFQSSAGLSATTQFLTADDPQAFLTGLANSAVADDQQADLLTQLQEQQQVLSSQEKQAASELDSIAAARQQLAAHRAELTDKTQQAEDLLADLQAKQRARLLALEAADEDPAADAPAGTDADLSRAHQRLGTDDAASGRAAVAVQTALAQVGDPYVYGAAGPDAFDCSGLTMYAWAAAGVSIPHSSGLQPSSGTPVAVSDLSPGDLVFYYSPISHVGMYIGNGQIVHAPHTGSYVQVVPVDSMPIAAAVHIG